MRLLGSGLSFHIITISHIFHLIGIDYKQEFWAFSLQVPLPSPISDIQPQRCPTWQWVRYTNLDVGAVQLWMGKLHNNLLMKFNQIFQGGSEPQTIKTLDDQTRFIHMFRHWYVRHYVIVIWKKPNTLGSNRNRLLRLMVEEHSLRSHTKRWYHHSGWAQLLSLAWRRPNPDSNWTCTVVR